jgi:hypothetical protein
LHSGRDEQQRFAAKANLPEPIEALEPYKERLHIINGLHGMHTSPSHSAFFGALGGYRGSDGVPPSGPTIDYELSKVLPQTLLPHLCIGVDSIENMTTTPTLATLSASGAGQPIFKHSNPNHLYQSVTETNLSSPKIYARVSRRSFGNGSMQPDRILATAPAGERLGILAHPSWIVSHSGPSGSYGDSRLREAFPVLDSCLSESNTRTQTESNRHPDWDQPPPKYSTVNAGDPADAAG